MRTFKSISITLLLFTLMAYIGYQLSNASDMSTTVFTTIKGEKISMTSLKGKVVLINFWATDCASCIEEMPQLITTYNQYQSKGLEIIAVAMPYDPPAQVVNFVTQKALPFPVMHDGYAEITQKVGGVNVTPTAYIYNKEGKRIRRIVGRLNFENLHTLLNKELS